MLILLIIFIIILSIILYVLFMKIGLYIDSDEERYIVKAGGLISVSLFPDRNWKSILIKFPFFEKKIDITQIPEKRKLRKDKKEKAKPAKEKKISGSNLNIGEIREIFSIGIESLKRLSHKFKVSYFVVDFDTKNFCINGNLFPFLSYLSTEKIDLNVNFTGRRYFSTSFYFRIGWLIPTIAGTYFRVRKYFK